MNYYTADPHFFHERILEFCDRPFTSIGEMNGRILAHYQASVGPDDDLWIVGDVAMVRSDMADQLSAMLQSIPGRKHLIVGNHDEPWVRALPVWTSVHDMVEIIDDGTRLTLCHYPMITWPGARRGALQLFGHVHQNWQGSRKAVNVGVDVWDFKPVTIREIRKRAAGMDVNPLWSKVEPRS
ncbi:MAG: metallophosphoesterase [Loktanella sp.]|nr:metallophosphoesterase [Loktanella sp.]